MYKKFQAICEIISGNVSVSGSHDTCALMCSQFSEKIKDESWQAESPDARQPDSRWVITLKLARYLLKGPIVRHLETIDWVDRKKNIYSFNLTGHTCSWMIHFTHIKSRSFLRGQSSCYTAALTGLCDLTLKSQQFWVEIPIHGSTSLLTPSVSYFVCTLWCHNLQSQDDRGKFILQQDQQVHKGRTVCCTFQ